jgi:hypothetical protein
MTTKSAQELMGRLSVALDVNQPLPRDLADWLAEGFMRFRSSDTDTTLCRALGLSKSKAAQRAVRNYWLRIAADRVALNPHLSQWSRAKRLSDAIINFESIMWPAIRDSRQIVSELTPLRAALYQAKNAVNNARLPISPHTLYKVLQVLYKSG